MEEINIRLDAFEGPLDLLYHLIEKNEIDIYDIPIASLTEQYLAYLDAAEDRDMDGMSEFLLMAATLLEIKSKMLLPKPKTEEEVIGAFQILQRVGPVAYRTALPPFLSRLHDVFHVSQLRNYVHDPSYVIELDKVQVRDNLTFDVSPIRIADRRIKVLRGKEIPLVKVI